MFDGNDFNIDAFILFCGIINKFGKMKPVFLRYKKEIRNYVYSNILSDNCLWMFNGNRNKNTICAIISALAETIIAPIIYLNPTPRDSMVLLK